MRIFSEGSPADSKAIPLSTKLGTPILNERKLERDPRALCAAEKMAKTSFGSIRTRSLSGTYNCVGMVFGCRRTVIQPSEIDKVLSEDKYSPVRQTEVSLGDIVIYYASTNAEPRHIGIVAELDPLIQDVDQRIIILSQWGYDGEYLHRLNDAPAVYGTVKKFFTDRTRPICP